MMRLREGRVILGRVLNLLLSADWNQSVVVYYDTYVIR